MDRILLLDTNNYVWLGNISFKPKATGYEDSGSMNAPETGKLGDTVAFNFFRNLRSLVETFVPHKIIACLEGHPAFRYELLADYKGNRIIKTGAATDKDKNRREAKAKFDAAMPEVIRLIKHLPITTMRHPLYETDDLIGSLVEDLKDEDVVVVSNDSDFIQLLQKGYKQLRLYSPSKKAMQVAPSDYHYLTHKILTGDKRTDNIPGMMGPKTAVKLLNDPTKFKTWMSVEENRARFSVNSQLITLASVPLDEVEINEGSFDPETLRIEFEQLAFASILKEPYFTRFVQTFNTVKLVN